MDDQRTVKSFEVDKSKLAGILEIKGRSTIRIRRISKSGLVEKSLGQCYQIELSVIMKMFHLCTVQYGSHQSHVPVEFLKYS